MTQTRDTSTSLRPRHRALIVMGITHPQTCVILSERLRALKSAGFRVVLISSPGPLLSRLAAEESVETWEIPLERGISPLADIVALIRLYRVLKHLRPDLTEFSTPKAGLLGNIAARLCRVPRRIYLLRGLRLETLTGLKRFAVLAAERVAAACAHRVLCNSQSLRCKSLALRVAPEQKLELIGRGSSNGVDVERFSPGPSAVRESLGIPRDVPVVGFVGRLTRDKGVPDLVEAFEQVLAVFPAARLLLVGWFDDSEDALDQDLHERIAGHPRILCTGFVPDAAPYYRAMDLMVLPTWREGFPNVVLEASATGIPVVTTLSTGSRDAVIPEVTGLLIPPGYPEAIAEAAVRLIRSPDDRHRMGRAARRWVIEQYVSTRVLGLTVDFYNRLLAGEQPESTELVPVDAAAAEG